jgi:FkbM family methyltransferase
VSPTIVTPSQATGASRTTHWQIQRAGQTFKVQPVIPSQATGASRTTHWQIQRAGQTFKFQLELRPSEPMEKMILDCFDARVLYERDVAALMINVLRVGGVVVDIGANCGFFTILAATLVGPSGHVVAIEPSPACLTRLRTNLALNELTNVAVVDRVATERSGEAQFYLNSDSSGGNALWNPGDHPVNPKSRENPVVISVPATTVDDELRQRGVATPKLIKIDTEGAEQQVLQGAMGHLANCRIPFIVAELHEFALAKLGNSQQSLRGLMERLGYSSFGLYFSNSIPKFIPPGSEIRSPFIINLLFSTPEKIAEYWPVAMVDPRSPV